MARKLCNVGVVLGLLMGCFGGVLAAALCPHASCKTTAAASVHTATHDEHSSGRGHESATHEDHSNHVQTHEGHAAEPTAREESQGDTGELHAVVPAPHDPFCTHCVGRNEAPPSSYFERQTNPARKGGESAAPRAAALITAHAVVYVREITPAQHAPPGRSARHLLLNVFRI